MIDPAKDALAAMVGKRWADFQMALSDSKRKYPTPEFKKFARSVRRYIAGNRNEPLVYRKVVQVVNGLTDSLKVGRDPTRSSKKRID
jgi:hypothetical protein